MDTRTDSRENGGRPYRSHLQPACYPCRSRKSRCKTTTYASSTCDACHAQGTPCVYPPSSSRPATASSHSRRRRASHKNSANSSSRIRTPRARCLSSTSPTISQRILQPYVSAEVERHEATSSSSPSTHQHQLSATPSNHANHPTISALVSVIAESEQGSSHVVSPAIADDDRVFHEYFSSTSYGQSKRMVRSHLNSSIPSRIERPILFSTVPKRGQREEESRQIAAGNLEAIEGALHPHCNDLIDL